MNIVINPRGYWRDLYHCYQSAPLQIGRLLSTVLSTTRLLAEFSEKLPPDDGMNAPRYEQITIMQSGILILCDG